MGEIETGIVKNANCILVNNVVLYAIHTNVRDKKTFRSGKSLAEFKEEK